MASVKRSVEIIDVGPRDGLQNEPTILDVATKVDFIDRLVGAGIRRMEAVSFVNPKRVPQMAEAEKVLAALPDDDGVTYIGLVLNRHGLDRALDAGCKEINYALVASDAFSQKNQGTTIEQAVDVYEEIATVANQLGLPEGNARAHAEALREKYNLEAVILTRGKQGTTAFTAQGWHEGATASFASAPNADSVGAGDACTAALLTARLLGRDWQATLDLANRHGAFIASQPGATPLLPDEVWASYGLDS